MEVIHSESQYGNTIHHLTPPNIGKISKTKDYELNYPTHLHGQPFVNLHIIYQKAINDIILRLHNHQDSPLAYWLKEDTNPLIVALDILKKNIQWECEDSIKKSYRSFISNNVNKQSNDIFWLLHAAELISFHSGWCSRFVSMANPKERCKCTLPYEKLKFDINLDKEDKTYWTNTYATRIWKGTIPQNFKIEVCFDNFFWTINENETFYAVSSRCPESQGIRDFTNILHYQDQKISEISNKWCPLNCTVIPKPMADNINNGHILYHDYSMSHNASIPQSWFQEYKLFNQKDYSTVTDFSSKAQKIVNQLTKKSIKTPAI